MLDLDQIRASYPEELRPFGTNLLREYLQHKILESTYRSRHGARLSFMGGTCIHLVHGCPRFSEDLDFDTGSVTAEEFRELAVSVRKDLEQEGYTVELTVTATRAYRAFLRFPSILHRSGLTGHREKRLLIQMDAEPQHVDYPRQSVILNKLDVFCRIHTVPADVLLAQKCLCILARPRPMGRDFFDAAYLIGRNRPSLAYLQAKLGVADLREVKERLLARCHELDLAKLAADVEPFTPRARDTERVAFFPEVLAAAPW